MPKSAEERREVRSGLLRQVKAAGLAGAFLKTRHALAPRRQRLEAALPPPPAVASLLPHRCRRADGRLCCRPPRGGGARDARTPGLFDAVPAA